MPAFSNFLEIQAASATKKDYGRSVKTFLECVYQPQNGTDWDLLSDQYIARVKARERDPLQDLLKFAVCIKDLAPNTKTGRVHQARLFLEYSGIEFTTVQLRVLRNKLKGRRTITQDRIPTREEIQRLFTHTNPLLRAFLHIANSTGMRRNEILGITWVMVDLESDPARISIPAKLTKTQHPRMVFLTDEAKKELIRWRDYRATYFEKNRNDGGIPVLQRIKDPRLFPVIPATIEGMWNVTVEKSGLTKRDISTNRREVHIHSFRKRVRTELSKGSGAARDMAEQILGHRSVLRDAYFRVTPEELAEWFKENQHLLWINTPVNVNTPEVKAALEEKEKKIQELEERITQQEKISEMTQRLLHHPEVLLAYFQKHPEMQIL